MEIDFTKLNPMMTQIPLGHELNFNCPRCNNVVSIRVKLNGQPEDSVNGRFWGLTLENGKGWDGATITPSINNHPVSRKGGIGCHFSVIKGVVHP